VRTIVDLVVVGVPAHLVPLALDGLQDIDPELHVALAVYLTGAANYAVRNLQERPDGVTYSRVITQAWTISRDPDALRTYQPPHDCETCRVGIARAAEVVETRESDVVAIGTITYEAHDAGMS
jgi:hypothetical protein